MIDALLKKECNLQFFHNNDYIRKKCTSCGSYFWTLDRKSSLCGDQPCVEFNFINKPLSLQTNYLRSKISSIRRRSSAVEHCFRKAGVGGSNPPVGSYGKKKIFKTVKNRGKEKY